MLVTSLYWWLYDGDRFEMSVAESLCWRLFSLCWWITNGDFLNVLNRSPTSQTCHQHIWSQTSVSNIDVNPKSFTMKPSSRNANISLESDNSIVINIFDSISFPIRQSCHRMNFLNSSPVHECIRTTTVWYYSRIISWIIAMSNTIFFRSPVIRGIQFHLGIVLV